MIFTEGQIRAVLEKHHPTLDNQYDEGPLCSCSTRIGLEGYTGWTSDHFIDKLKEYL